MREEGNNHHEYREDYWCESRMYVVFANGGRPKRAFGPYRAVQVTTDSVWVFEEARLLRLARKEPGCLWEVPDGSDEPVSFRDVLMLCPAAWVTAEQIEDHLGPREHG
jgi:hypothetical protein